MKAVMVLITDIRRGVFGRWVSRPEARCDGAEARGD